MVESISSSQGLNFYQHKNYTRTPGSLLNFDKEDQAIISSQARILIELEKYNAGEGNEIDLVIASSMGRAQVEAAAKAINSKGEMFDAIMEIVDQNNEE